MKNKIDENSIHVYYDDGYPDNGDIGLKSFSFEKAALNFIKDRMQSRKSKLENYTYIVGEIKSLVPKEVIVEIKVKK